MFVLKLSYESKPIFGKKNMLYNLVYFISDNYVIKLFPT